jgi:hypothetical protein
MKRILGIGLVAVAFGLAALVNGCSTSSSAPNSFESFIRNITAAQCDNPQAALANVPVGFLTPAQALEIVQGVCTGIFGTAPAPTPAPGMQPAIPGAPSVVATPSAAASPG